MVQAFRRALCSQPGDLRDKIVLDLTSHSSGIYSMMSVSSGTSEVYFYEKTESEANRTRAVLRHNGFEPYVQVIVSKTVQNMRVPADKVIKITSLRACSRLLTCF